MAHEAHLAAIGKLEIGAETTFGTEASGYTYLRTMPIDRSSLAVATFRDDHQRQLDVETSRILGPHSGGTISTQMYLHGFSSTEPSAPPAHIGSNQGSATGFDFILDLLAGAVGSIHSGGFVTNETASTTSILKADSQDLTIGQFVAWEDSSGDWHVNSITNIDTGPNPDEMPLLQTATAVPAGNKIFGAHTIFQTTRGVLYSGDIDDSNGDPIQTKSFSLRYTGAGEDDRTVMTGAWPSAVSLEMNVSELPLLNVDWTIAHWAEDSLATNLGMHSGVGADNGGLNSSEAWSFPTCEALTHAHVSFGSSQGDTRQVQGISLDIGLEITPIKDPNATSGVGGYFIVKRTPKITLTMMRDVSEEVTDFFTQQGRTLMCWAGSQAGKLIAIQMPNARIEEWPAPSDTDGAVMSQITFVANEYTGDTGAITSDAAPGDKQFRIGFL